ncbi:MAG: FG-GAP repeat domain-containing protein, partial [Phycisphaerales bacterium]
MLQKIIVVIVCFLLFCCSETYIDAPAPVETLSALQPLGDLPKETDRPTIAHVRITDLDQDGKEDVVLCDVSGHRVSWIRDGTETTILAEVDGPVHAEVVDIDNDGDLDVLVATMGVILPSTAHTGKVIILENDGNEIFTKRIIAENIQRVTDVQAGDLDGDGDLDLSVAQFGYTEGQVQW